MKLTTNNGVLELPEDFSFEVERNNPFLSEDGDATVPATIPSSPHNLSILNNIHRIDKADRFMKKVPAVLQHGVWSKHGQLIIDTINKHGGIAVSFAIENSDIYSQYKEKTLKEITANKIKTDWETIDDLIAHLNSVAFSHSLFDPNRPDYDLFPVLIAKYEDEDGNIVYQYNNEVRDTSKGAQSMKSQGLVSEARTVHEADYIMSVPKGYGISPFLYLNKAIDVVFEEMGYHVVSNCFSEFPLSQICLLNNSSDTIVKGDLPYSDMLPSCTLSEFIEFLKNKFCVTIRVDSSSKKVWVEKMQDHLSQNYFDIDISNMVDGDFDITLNNSSRVVISSDTSMEGSEPAAESLDDLIKQYGCYVEVGDLEYLNIGTPQQTVFDCLIKRKTTGEFYELRRNFKTGRQFAVRLGTDNFSYDRKNSDDIEEFHSIDVIPPVLSYNDSIYLYLGDRVHHHTSFNNKEESENQKIMICWSFEKRWSASFFDWYEHRGTLSKYTSELSTFPFSLNAYDMYSYFWSKYNTLLLNNKVEVKGRVNYSYQQLANLDMTAPKYYKGQLLLPKSISFNLGKNKGSNESRFILVKEFVDQIEDEPILPIESPMFKWTKKGGTQITNQRREFKRQFPMYWDDNGYMGGGDDYIPLSRVAFMVVCQDIDIVMTGDTDVYLGPPTFDGQESIKFVVNYQLEAKYIFVDVNGTPTVYAINQVNNMIQSMESYYCGTDEVYFKAEPV